MKATGIVRRIDDLGRVVIPKEIRRTMRIREGDPLEIYTAADGEVIFKKYSPMGELEPYTKQYAEVLHRATGMPAVICDRDRVIAATGRARKELLGKSISSTLEAMMEAETAKDKLVDMYEKFRNSQATRDKKTLIEGVNFEFKEDPTLKKLYMDEKDLQEKKEVVQPESPDVVEDIYDLAQQIDQEKLIDMINEMDGEEGQSTEDDIPILMFEEVDFEDL